MKFPDKYRIVKGDFASNEGDQFGAFRIPLYDKLKRKVDLFVLASPDGAGWDHASVTTSKNRTPTWDEMAHVKSIFWDDSEAVMQLHVPADQHINIHPNALHLWRPQKQDIPLPPSILV